MGWDGMEWNGKEGNEGGGRLYKFKSAHEATDASGEEAF